MAMSAEINDDPRLTSYVLGELPESECAAFEREMAASPALAAAVDDIRQSAAAVMAALAAEPTSMILGDDRRRLISGAGERTDPLPRAPGDAAASRAASSRRRWLALTPVTLALGAAIVVLLRPFPDPVGTNLAAHNRIVSRELAVATLEQGRNYHLDAMSLTGRRFAGEAEQSLSKRFGSTTRLRGAQLGEVQLRRETVAEENAAAARPEAARMSLAGVAERNPEREAAGDNKQQDGQGDAPVELGSSGDKVDEPDTNNFFFRAHLDDLDSSGANSPAPAEVPRLSTGSAPGAGSDADRQDRRNPNRPLWRSLADPANGRAAPAPRDAYEEKMSQSLQFGLSEGLSEPNSVLPFAATEARELATVDGRYSELLDKLDAPQDAARFGRIFDYGYWSGTQYAGRRGLAPGYWVYVEPDWFIWGKRKADEPAQSSP